MQRREAVEYHVTGTQNARDDDRIRRVAQAGWRVIRLSGVDLPDLDSVVDRVRGALLP